LSEERWEDPREWHKVGGQMGGKLGEGGGELKKEERKMFGRVGRRKYLYLTGRAVAS
jgi:hypothetical protein